MFSFQMVVDGFLDVYYSIIPKKAIVRIRVELLWEYPAVVLLGKFKNRNYYKLTELVVS